ncbi:secreted RxLR effector protein 161-like [Gastrolobium bilobum]|uniref:secreted RxLR effector protein 161-like n=1 Tax=Gastrolobium bilobum TaxID=150636 RepID=UPI002AB1902D|nr:secreted RxLR effector protein 161-like [Gastrolobium bilobum]
MYATIYTRLDIAQAVRGLSRYMSKRGNEHLMTVNRVFHYLRGTSNIGLCYEGVKGSRRQTLLELRYFVDTDWGYDIDIIRSTSGYVVSSFNGTISWISKRQNTVALSTTKAEYMTLSYAVKEAI